MESYTVPHRQAKAVQQTYRPVSESFATASLLKRQAGQSPPSCLPRFLQASCLQTGVLKHIPRSSSKVMLDKSRVGLLFHQHWRSELQLLCCLICLPRKTWEQGGVLAHHPSKVTSKKLQRRCYLMPLQHLGLGGRQGELLGSCRQGVQDE